MDHQEKRPVDEGCEVLQTKATKEKKSRNENKKNTS